MSNEPLDPMDPELSALLDVERAAVPPAGSLAKVWARVEGLLPPGGGGSDTGGGSGPAGGSGWLASHAVHVAAGTFVVGALAGATAHAVFRPPPAERIVYVEHVAPPTASFAATAAPAELPAASTSAPTSLSSVVPAGPTPRVALSASSASTLSPERAVLDDARVALGAGDAARAMALLEEHARRFPKAQLGEEREALAIQALVVLRRFDEARSRAARFRAAVPNSLFLPAIDASLASIP